MLKGRRCRMTDGDHIHTALRSRHPGPEGSFRAVGRLQGPRRIAGATRLGARRRARRRLSRRAAAARARAAARPIAVAGPAPVRTARPEERPTPPGPAPEDAVRDDRAAHADARPGACGPVGIVASHDRDRPAPAGSTTRAATGCREAGDRWRCGRPAAPTRNSSVPVWRVHGPGRRRTTRRSATGRSGGCRKSVTGWPLVSWRTTDRHSGAAAERMAGFTTAASNGRYCPATRRSPALAPSGWRAARGTRTWTGRARRSPSRS